MHTLRDATCQPKMTLRNLLKKGMLTWALHEGSGIRGKQNGEFLYFHFQSALQGVLTDALS